MYFWEPCVTTIQSISKSEDGPTIRASPLQSEYKYELTLQSLISSR